MDSFDKLRDAVIVNNFAAVTMTQDVTDDVPNVEPRHRGIRVYFEGEPVGWLVPNSRFEPSKKKE